VSIYYLSDSRDAAFAIDRKQLCAHFTRPAHADGKSSFDGVLPIPRSYLFLLATEPTRTALFLIIRVIVFRIAISANHETGLIIGENHGLHRS
jgi:hypothetical protein